MESHLALVTLPCGTPPDSVMTAENRISMRVGLSNLFEHVDRLAHRAMTAMPMMGTGECERSVVCWYGIVP